MVKYNYSSSSNSISNSDSTRNSIRKSKSNSRLEGIIQHIRDRNLDDLVLCSMARFSPCDSWSSSQQRVRPYDISKGGVDRILFDFDLCSMVCIARGKLTFKLESASSTVGAPCNEVSLCNRAGWLGMGYVEHTVARDGLLPQSGRVFRIRCVSPCRCILGPSPQ